MRYLAQIFVLLAVLIPAIALPPSSEALTPGQGRLVLSPRTGYPEQVLADSPSAYWRLGELSGTTAADESGNANVGTHTGGVTLGRAGALVADPGGTLNTGVVFDGSTGYVVGGTSMCNPGSGDFTASIWYSSGVPAAVQTIMGKGRAVAAGTAYGWELVIRPTNTRLQFTINSPTGGVTTVLYTNAVVADGLYHMVTVQRSGTTANLFFDGVLVGTTTAAGVAGDLTSVDAFAIGRRQNNTQYFPGTVDDFDYEPTALSAERIAAHYNAGTGR